MRGVISAPAEVAPFEGGYTRKFPRGRVSSRAAFDVAITYPSLLLHIALNPKKRSRIFISALRGCASIG